MKLPGKEFCACLRRPLFVAGLILLLVGMIVGPLLIYTSMGVVLNFILMPAVGMLGFWLLGKWGLLVPVSLFPLSFLIFLPESGWYGLVYSALFSMFCAVGVVMGWLLRIALGKSKDKDKEPRPLWQRLLSAGVVIVPAVLLIMMTVSFTGDPISAYRAKKAAEKYVLASDTYRTMDLELTDATYNFKDSKYVVWASSASNPDICFDILCKGGKVVGDGYQNAVVENGNVVRRFADEYSTLLKVRLAQAGLGSPSLFVHIDREDEITDWYPGMPFDPYLPAEKTLMLYPTMEEISIEAAADYMVAVAELLDEKGYDFAYMGLFVLDEETGARVNIDDISVKRVLQPDLAEYLTEVAKAYEEQTALPKTDDGTGSDEDDRVPRVSFQGKQK